MEFPKLNKHLIETLSRLEFNMPTAFEAACIAPVKSGQDAFCFAPVDSGKTTSLIISVVQKLEAKAVGEAPRALIFVRNKEAALALEESFRPFLRFSDLRIFSAFDQHDITGQKDTIFDGVDILIGTPARISKLFFLNGVNISSLKMIIIEDGEFLTNSKDHISIIRVNDSAKGCQRLVFADKDYNHFDKLRKSFMSRAKTIMLPKTD